MDDPMAIIRRHHTAELDQPLLLKATSDVSEVMGGFNWAMGQNQTYTMSWLDEKDDIIAQLSTHGAFVTDCVPKRNRYQIAGMCYLLGVPLFTEDDVLDMIDMELPPEGKTAIN